MPRSATARRFHQRRHGPLAGLEIEVHGVAPQLEDFPPEALQLKDVPAEYTPAVQRALAWAKTLQRSIGEPEPASATIALPQEDWPSSRYVPVTLLDAEDRPVGMAFADLRAEDASIFEYREPSALRPKRRRSGWR